MEPAVKTMYSDSQSTMVIIWEDVPYKIGNKTELVHEYVALDDGRLVGMIVAVGTGTTLWKRC